MGRVTVDGNVVDHRGDRIGRIRPSADSHARTAPGIHGTEGTP